MNTTKQTLRFYWSNVRQHRGYFFGMVIADVAGMILFRVIPPFIAAIVIRRLASGDYVVGELWQSFGREIMLFALSQFLGGALLKRLELFFRFKLEMHVEQKIKQAMFDHYTVLDTGFHADSFTGSLTSRSSKLVGSYIRFADSVLHPTIQMFAVVGSIFVIIAPRSLPFLGLFVVVSILFILSVVKLSPRISKIFMAKADADNRDTGILADMVTNIIAVKSFAAQQAERKLFKESTDKSKNLLDQAGKAVFVRDLVVATITTGFQAAAIIVAIVAIVEQNANLAIVFLILAYADTLVDQLWYFGTTTITNFDRCMGDAREGIVTLHTKPRVVDPIEPSPFKSIRGQIEFRNVTFDHNDADDGALFSKLNLRVKPGEKIGLVGHSGGGKSTLTKLIMRLMDIDSGEILIDGQGIATVKQDDLRRYLSYVPQEPVMFHRSLAENIGYGKEHVTRQEIEAAAKMAHAHDFITNLPEGYKTLVGERGIKLSGGQRQRVAIARAMLKNAPILLLDEATSALDSESESLIQDALWKLMENKTAIVIAHRLSTIQKMDRIVVLENGEIVEEGSHNELLKNDGIYSELWKHQTGGFIED